MPHIVWNISSVKPLLRHTLMAINSLCSRYYITMSDTVFKFRKRVRIYVLSSPRNGVGIICRSRSCYLESSCASTKMGYETKWLSVLFSCQTCASCIDIFLFLSYNGINLKMKFLRTYPLIAATLRGPLKKLMLLVQWNSFCAWTVVQTSV